MFLQKSSSECFLVEVLSLLPVQLLLLLFRLIAIIFKASRVLYYVTPVSVCPVSVDCIEIRLPADILFTSFQSLLMLLIAEYNDILQPTV